MKKNRRLDNGEAMAILTKEERQCLSDPGDMASGYRNFPIPGQISADDGYHAMHMPHSRA